MILQVKELKRRAAHRMFTVNEGYSPNEFDASHEDDPVTLWNLCVAYDMDLGGLPTPDLPGVNHPRNDQAGNITVLHPEVRGTEGPLAEAEQVCFLN